MNIPSLLSTCDSLGTDFIMKESNDVPLYRYTTA